MNAIDGGVAAPEGFMASGVAAEIKAGSTKKDCALILSDTEATVAGMFTKNIMKSPPVFRNQEVCARGTARAVFINSGNANAATGQRGHDDVRATAAHLAQAAKIPESEACICSTGVIGVPLPMDNIRQGVDACVSAVSREGSADAAAAIMTTDTVPKERAYEVPLSTGSIKFGAIAKGSGMISPNMATMICIITTDTSIDAVHLQKILRDAVNVSFNQISVDNDMSTSDTVLVLANGQSNTPTLLPGSADFEVFENALVALCREMAQWLVRDGEGVTKFVEIVAEGTDNDEDAKTIARALGNSLLCKTAFFGEDPNWGRFACATGYAGVDFDPSHLSIWLDDLEICTGGLVADYVEADAAAIMKQPEFRLRVSVGEGPGQATFWTSDLSHEYVSINADYRS